MSLPLNPTRSAAYAATGVLLSATMAMPAAAVDVEYFFGTSGVGTVGGQALSGPSNVTSGFVLHNDVGNPQYGALRRPAIEIDLGRIRSVSTDPDDITNATFDFYIDDAVFSGRTVERIVSEFDLELYVDTADGVITSEPDANGVNADYDGGAFASVEFNGVVVDESAKPPISADWLAGTVAEVIGPAVTYTGTTGDIIEYISNYSDDDLDQRGFLGFSIDVTNALQTAITDPANDWLGFRLLTTVDDVPYTSLDRSLVGRGEPAPPREPWQPSVTVSVVPEPGLAAAGVGLGTLVSLRRRR